MPTPARRAGAPAALAALATLATVLTVSLAACSPGTVPGAGVSGSESAPAPATAEPLPLDGTWSDVLDGAPDATRSDTAPLSGDQAGAASEPRQTSVIRTGEIVLAVDDPVAAAEAVASLATEFGGSVEQRTVDRGAEGRAQTAQLRLRVPEAELDAAIERISKVGAVRHETRSEQDVTLARGDLQARVAALGTSVDRLQQLLGSAASTTELIEVERALSERQQELDGLRAQLDLLEDRVALATVDVSLTTDEAIPGGPGTFWEGLVLGARALAAAAAGALVVAGILLPWAGIGAVLALVVWVVVRGIRRRRTR